MVEAWPAVVVEARQLTVQDGALTAPQLGRQIVAELAELPVGVPVPRHEPNSTRLHVRERAEPVVLHLEDPVGMVEGLRSANQRHRLEVTTSAYRETEARSSRRTTRWGRLVE